MQLVLLCLLSAAGLTVSQQRGLSYGSSCEGDGRCRKSSECGSFSSTRGGCGETEDGIPLICCPQGACPPPFGTKATIKCLEWISFTNRSDLTVQVGVTGGRDAMPKEFPFMAQVGFGQEGDISWECGGSLISELFVLSAAHCSYLGRGRTNPARWVRVGELDQDREDDDARPEIVRIQRIYNHPRYNAANNQHDISLYRLATKPVFSEYVKPTCIQTQHKLMFGDYYVSGFGLIEQAGPSSSILQTALLSTYNTSYMCQETYSTYRDNVMVCAFGTDGRDACRGDSGGPLTSRLKYPPSPIHNVVGVTSFGRSCGRYAGVYTRVSYYIDWIEDIVWPDHEVLATRS